MPRKSERMTFCNLLEIIQTSGVKPACSATIFVGHGVPSSCTRFRRHRRGKAVDIECRHAARNVLCIFLG